MRGGVRRRGPAVLLFRSLARHPEVRRSSPVSMAAQRDRLVSALARIVSDVPDVAYLSVFLRALGRDHRKFGTVAEHYAGGRYQSAGPRRRISAGMTGPRKWLRTGRPRNPPRCPGHDRGREGGRRGLAACWEATVISHEVRAYDVAVFRVSTDQPVPYQPGQSVSVEYAERPRIWRLYSVSAKWVTVAMAPWTSTCA